MRHPRGLSEGRGSILMRGRVAVETIRKEGEAPVITEIPYQVNKATMIEKIAELVRDKRHRGHRRHPRRERPPGHVARRDRASKRDAVADVVPNQVYCFSPLQTSFGVNMVAPTGGRPQLMNLKDLIQARELPRVKWSRGARASC